MKYELLLQSNGTGDPFPLEQVERALGTRPVSPGTEGERIWRLQSGEVQVRALRERGAQVGLELRLPLSGRLELIRELVQESVVLAQETQTRVLDPQLGRALVASDEGAVADQFLRTAQYAGQYAGVSGALDAAYGSSDDGSRSNFKLIAAVGVALVVLYLTVDFLLSP